MVRRRDRNDIEILVLECLADVLETFRSIATFLANFLAARLKEAAVGIDQVCHLNVFQLQVLVDVSISLPMNASNADANCIVSAEDASGGFGAGDMEKRKRGAREDRFLKKSSTSDFHGRTLLAHAGQQAVRIALRLRVNCWALSETIRFKSAVSTGKY